MLTLNAMDPAEDDRDAQRTSSLRRRIYQLLSAKLPVTQLSTPQHPAALPSRSMASRVTRPELVEE